MSVYSVLVSYNAGTSFTQYNLSGTLQPKGVYVVANSSARGGLLALANATSFLINFDGTDAVALLHNTDTIDVIGQFNVNPGPTGWPVGTGSTHQHTLIRNYYTYSGDTNWARASLTWDVYRAELIDSLPFHYTDTCGGLKPVATVRFLNPYDSIPQILQSFDTNIVVEVNNPTPDTVHFYIAADASLSTAQEGYGYDYVFTNQQTISPPGITYDTLRPLFIFPRPEITPTKTIVFRFINLPVNMKAVPDSVFTLYLTNNNKFVVSFLGAGYSYPKGSGFVKIPLVASTYSSQPTTVDVTLSIGNAIKGQDFLFNDTTVTFPAFSLDTQGVWVNILNNDVYQSNKQVNFDLSNLTNGAAMGINAFTLTIINNDSLAGGVPESELDANFKLFPNPVADQLVVHGETDLRNVQITDIVGHVISSLGTLVKGTNSINVSQLSRGTYFLCSGKNAAILRQRFVKVE